jgi:capsular polysaccharide biosynthesis protein
LSEQTMDLHSASAALQRRWRLLAVSAAVGLVLGIAYVFVVPVRYSSTTLVLLPTPVGTQENVAEVETQVAIVMSTSVLGKAGAAVHPALTPRQLQGRVRVEAPTIQLIQITAFSTRVREAQVLSQSVADSYISVVRETARTLSATTMADLRSRETNLSAQFATLKTEIDASVGRQRLQDPLSAEGRREAQLLGQLRSQQADVSLQLDKVKDAIATSQALGGASQAATSVIQPATPGVGPGLLQRLLLWAALGSVAGLLVAAGVVIFLGRRDPRVRTRDDIADALGSTVLASVESHGQRTVAAWSSFLRHHQVSPIDAWAFRQFLRALVRLESQASRGSLDLRSTGRVHYPHSILLITVADDHRGVAVGPQLAVFASALGITTRLAAVQHHVSAAPLWAACSRPENVEPRPHLVVDAVPADPPAAAGLDESGKPGESATAEESGGAEGGAPVVGGSEDLLIMIAVVDREKPSLRNLPATAATVVALAPGVATRADLAKLAVAVDDAGRPVDGVLVADPDSTDRTTGRHLQPERVNQSPLPVRLTGLGPLAVVTGRGKTR